MTYYTGTAYISTLYVQADSPEAVPGVTRQVAEILKSRHRPGAEYDVENLASLLDSARKISRALMVLLVVIAVIALAISGVGIMNIMLVTVTERTREIGIRRAVGAPRDAILYQFLMEAFLISGTGALVGILIAISIPVAINLILRVIPEAVGIRVPVSWVSVVLAFVLSCSTGLIFGYLPANRAARLHPTESLRYE
jgi:putative ABC transport system permease protein